MPDELDRVIGERIKDQRERKLKITQPALIGLLAEAHCEIKSVSALSLMETGKRALTPAQLQAFSEVFDVSIETLMTPLSEDTVARRAALVGGLEDSLYDLLHALSAVAAACGALDEAGIRDVTLTELRRDNFVMAAELDQAHPLARKWWVDILRDRKAKKDEAVPGLLSDGLHIRQSARKRAGAGDTRATTHAELLRVGDKAHEHMGDDIPAELMKDPTGYTNTETIKDSK